MGMNNFRPTKTKKLLLIPNMMKRKKEIRIFKREEWMGAAINVSFVT